MHRELDPAGVISRVEDNKCFIIGGARTYSRFAPHLTHLFLTFHPLVMNSKSLPLFSHLDGDLELEFINTVKVDGAPGIYQFQYKVKQ